MNRPFLRLLPFLILTAQVAPLSAQENAKPETVVPTEYVVLPATGQYGRLPLHRDAVEAQLVAGIWKNPAAGETLEAPDGRKLAWQTAIANDGTLDAKNLRGGYAFTTFEAPADGVMMLEAAGHAAVYVNGEPRAGDPYELGWLQLPVRVQKGANTLLFHLAAEKLTVQLTPPPADVFIADDDRTLPTIIRGEANTVTAGVPIVNASTDWLEASHLRTEWDDNGQRTAVRPIPPLSVRKVPLVLPAGYKEGDDHSRFEVQLFLGQPHESEVDQRPLAKTDVVLKVVGPKDVHVRTFRSRIDDSVQPYAARPADVESSTDNDKSPGIILTLHNAGATCEEHVAYHAPKTWAHVVAPQGRRAYGFDWEAWGRIDALEALADAQQHYANDPNRVYLTGHCMGGHGAWQLGATYPDRFAAVGASDGWVSFWSYGGGMPSFDDPTPIEEMLLRGYAPSETLKLLKNLVNTAVFIQHDPAADDVPVEQARFLRQELAAFHPNFVYYEAPAKPASDMSRHLGADSPRMMEFFQHCERPLSSNLASVDFTTADPAISDRCGFVVIDAQLEQLVPSRVELRQDHEAGTFVGTTSNVARLAIDASHLSPGTQANVTLDNQSFSSLEPAMLWFEYKNGKWSTSEPPPQHFKGPKRDGSFSLTFGNKPTLVYGTAGTDEENRWAEAKARYDAETFYYRAGGEFDVLPDVRFTPSADKHRNVILYGNADTNQVWRVLLEDCPVVVKRGEVIAGEHVETGDDLAVVMARPRPGSDTALVGVVGGTGPEGMRLTDRLRWFVSGITYPDLMIFGPKTLTDGNSDIRAWGYFGPDWGMNDAEIAWRETTP